MKIAYLNPWKHAAENQAYMSLAGAAPKLGLELVECADERAVERDNFDFVLSVASSVPKVADIPTYLNVHEPKGRFLGNAFYLRNFLTYDGFLTISDSLKKFIQDTCFGVGREERPGFYYIAPQSSALQTDFAQLVKDGALHLVYCGTNWDRRRPFLFKLLDGADVLRVHGPVHSWEKQALQSYAGPLPFDGHAPQQAYAAAGMGLVLLSAEHEKDDVISNRIFEITSVGAVAICPDMPWIRKWFSDSVFYFDRQASSRQIAQRILEIISYCKLNPTIAAQNAENARRTFERNFSAEKMLANLAEYHEEKVRHRNGKKSDQVVVPPRISVIMRCGGRPLDCVRRAFDSIVRQTVGMFTVIFVKYDDMDLSGITKARYANVAEFKEISVPGGNRSETLFAGLRQVETEYFAVLDDDDFLLSDHFETLFEAGLAVDPQFDLAFSGTVAITTEGVEIEKNVVWRRNIHTFGFNGEVKSVWDVTREFSSNCFVARTAALPHLDLVPDMNTAEDSLVVALVSRRKKPVFSYRATAFFSKASIGGSGFKQHKSRIADELTLTMRTEMQWSPCWLANASLGQISEHWSRAQQMEASQDKQEEMELIEQVHVGAAGIRLDRTIAAMEGSIGHVCYGPYIRLSPGAYCLTVDIGVLQEGKPSGQPVGRIEVVTSPSEWEAATCDLREGGIITLEFEIGKELSNESMEFRVYSSGRYQMEVRSIFLETMPGEPRP
jgi:hypothetical protein